MCGIVGVISSRRPVADIIVEGLKRLEYRGYDSSGLTLRNGSSSLTILKRCGKVAMLEAFLRAESENGLADVVSSSRAGAGHNRWATHGVPSDVNAHPHADCTGKLAVVHNGIIENFGALRAELLLAGHDMQSDTDTEVLAHLIEECRKTTKSLLRAVLAALRRVEGTYGIVVLSSNPNQPLIGARRGSPLLVGIGNGERYLASDAAAVREHTDKVVYLDDSEVVIANSRRHAIINLRGEPVVKKADTITWSLSQIQRNGFPHFMLKEIHEEPGTVEAALRGRLNVEDGTVHLESLGDGLLQDIRRVILVGCGTSWHAGLVGEYVLETVARIPVEVEYASEFRYRDPVIEPDTAVIAITQSGETIDTLEAMREAANRGATALSLVNVVGSTIARESQGVLHLQAGPEVGVASTKAFTSQVAALMLLALKLGQLHSTVTRERAREIARALEAIPAKIRAILATESAIRQIAGQFTSPTNFLFLGRGFNFPVALEGALKLKEISYIHAEGYPAAEMKHGPIALIDENMPVVFICTRGSGYTKVLNNMEQVRARGGRIITVATEGDAHVQTLAEHVLYVPDTLDMLQPLLTVIPLQLLAYHIAVLRGCDVDQPRNLAKAVTVE